ncbi:MAG: DsbA family protein [Pseudomonadota bacterium]
MTQRPTYLPIPMLTRRHALLSGAATLFAAATATTLRAQEADPRLVEMVLGDPSAPVELIEYASFTCPHCARFHNNVLPSLKSEYIESGKVKLVVREVFFDRYGLWAAMVARCGGQARYFGISDEIYRTQPSWTRAGNDAAVANALRQIGKLAGLTDDELSACLSDQAYANALVAGYKENAARDRIEATPTFLLNGETVSNRPWEELKSLIEAALS